MSNKKTIKRVLHITGNMNMGGQETFIMNLYRNIDRDKIQFDFVVGSPQESYYEKEIYSLGGNVYRITTISKNVFKHMIELAKLIKENNYDVIHRHTASSIILVDIIVAKIMRVKQVIVHSHSNKIDNKIIGHKICKKILKMFNITRLSCSKDAGEWLFGNKCNYTTIYNGIDISKYLFDINERERIRSKYNLQDKFVLGHIGRFSKSKNHDFIIDIFNNIYRQNNDARLLLVGDGELKDNIENKIKQLGLNSVVIVTGNQDNVSQFLNAMDTFIFPSIYEGLGIALIEAQVNGLQCIVSKNIQDEAIISSNVTKIDLDKNITVWSNNILSKKSSKINRCIDKNNLLINKFNINNTIKYLQNIYLC